MGKIKVLMVLGNTRRGGTQAFIMNVLRNIDFNKFQVDFAINNDFEGGWGPEMRALGCNIYIMPVFKVYNLFGFKRAWNDFLKGHHYDIIHGHTTNSAGIYLAIARGYGCKTIAHVHSTGFRGNVIERIMKYLFSKLAKKNADYWFACSPKAAQMLYGSAYTVYPNYYEIPNAIDVPRFRFKQIIRESIRISLGVNGNTFLCGHVGTFSTPKNHTFIIDIFAEILKRESNAKLLLIGEGDLKEPMIEKAKKMGILEKIIFRQNLGNVNEYLMAMDLFIFPSLFEGFGMASLEAQATGLNVIQSDVIPKETLLTNCVSTLSLSESASEWAETGLAMMTQDRNAINKVVESTKYNLCETIELITRLYNEMYIKNDEKENRYCVRDL